MKRLVSFVIELGVLAVSGTLAAAFSPEETTLESNIRNDWTRVAKVKLVDSKELALDGKRCGLLQTVDVVEAYQGDGGRFSFVTDVNQFSNPEDEYLVVAMRWKGEVPTPTACYEKGEKVECKEEPGDREWFACTGQAAWAAFSAQQRLFRIVSMPPETKLPGQWVLQIGSESILTAVPSEVRKTELPLPASGGIRTAYALEDLAKIIKSWRRSDP